MNIHKRRINNYRNYFIGKLLLILLISIPKTIFSQTGIYVPELKLFDTKMNGLVAKYNLVGGQMAITYEGKLVYNRGFGFADSSDKTMVQPNSIFRLASVSKSITSIAVMKLVEKGKFNLDAKVLGNSGILNDTQYLNAIDSRMYQITVRQLLNHSAGFNFDFANEPLWKTYDIAIAMGVVPPTNSFEVVLKWTLKNKILGFQPGTSASYSNFGYTLLGLVIEKVTGMKYEKYVKDSILSPLGIFDMYAGKTLKKDKYANEVSYYDYGGAPLSNSIYTGIPNSIPAQYGGYNWEVMTPAGGWIASAHDLCKLLTAVDGLTGRPDILSSKIIDTMMQKSINWPNYGLGWFITTSEHYHTGGIQGTATVIRTNKTNQISYAILFNALPQNYTPFYNEFISLVSNEFSNISSWPAHDLFDYSANNKSIKDHSKIAVYPNPVSSELFIDNLPDNLKVSIKIHNILGQKMIEKEMTGPQFSISLYKLQSGMYWLIIEDKNGVLEMKTFLKN